MTKQLIIGIATIAISGTALLATGMYAANTDTTGVSSIMTMKHMNPLKEKDIISTLSGRVSAPALQELETLMTKHKTEIETLKAKGTPIDKAAMEIQHTLFKTEMDSLMVKYPELKTAIPQNRFGNKREGENEDMKTIIATLPTSVQTELQTIRESYRTKQEVLRTEEKAKIDILLSAYPDVKAKLEASRPEGRDHKMKFQRGNN